MKAWLRSTWRFVLDGQVHTQSYGLLRIGLAAVLWAEYGHSLALWRDHDPLRQLFGLALLGAASLMGLGLLTRLSTAVVAAGLVFAYHYFGLQLGEKSAFVHAHSYLLMSSVVLLAFAPSGRSFSVDRWLRLARARALPQRGAAWPLLLIRLQLALVYFWGAVDKTNLAFLSGSRLQQMAYYYFGSHEGVRLPGFDGLLVAASIATVLLEYGLAFGLWFAPSRRWLIPCGLLFHFAIYVTLPVGTFSALSCVLYLAYFEPDALARSMRHMLVDEAVSTEPPRGGSA